MRTSPLDCRAARWLKARVKPEEEGFLHRTGHQEMHTWLPAFSRLHPKDAVAHVSIHSMPPLSCMPTVRHAILPGLITHPYRQT